MIRTVCLFTMVAVCGASPAQLMAGGPPLLFIPVDGVTADNAGQCAKLAEQALKERVREGAVTMRQIGDQWFVTTNFEGEIQLRRIEDAIQDSDFSLPRDELRLFGHVILEIDLQKAGKKELAAALEAMDFVAVADSNRTKKTLQITVDMPYPAFGNRSLNDDIAWDKFSRTDFSSVRSNSEPATTADRLPSYGDFRAAVEKAGASLQNITWSATYACRPLGCVRSPDSKTGKAKEHVAKR